MSFDPTIPLATDLLSQSQSDIQINFAQSNAIMGVDHVNFDNSLPAPALGKLGYLTIPADEGKHTFIHLKRVDTTTGTPGADPVTAANESALYAKYTGTTTELYYRYPSSGTVAQLLTVLASTLATPGSVTLSNGIIIKWGVVGGINTAGTVINFSGAFTTAVWSLVVTPESNTSRTIATNAPGLANFTCYSENNGTTVRYIAIGN
jgi:hypothetical protein